MLKASNITRSIRDERRSSGDPIVARHIIEGLAGTILEVPLGGGAESLTFLFESPWIIPGQSGANLCQFEEFKVTKIRASVPTGGYRCSLAFDYAITSFGWHSDWSKVSNDIVWRGKPLPIAVEALNSQGGVIEDWTEHTTHILCSDRSTRRRVIYDFNPDIYEIFIHARIVLTAIEFMHC